LMKSPSRRFLLNLSQKKPTKSALTPVSQKNNHNFVLIPA
jgi:hypothetical protein